MAARKHIGLKTKLAAAICTFVRPDENGELKKVISHEESMRMTEDQVLALYEWDHVIPVAHGGEDTHWNLTPLLKAEHREKTAKIDVPRIAKSKRIAKSEVAHAEAMTMKAERRDEVKTSKWPKTKWPSRPFPKKSKDKKAK